MRIRSRPTVDAGVAREQARMDAAKQASMEHCRALAEQRRQSGVKKGEGLVGGIHRDALFEAVRQEGPEVLSGAAKSWWDDQKRMNPWMCADGQVPDGNSLNGRVGRHGKVRERFRGGRWEHWDAKAGWWVPGEVSSRKGVQ